MEYFCARYIADFGEGAQFVSRSWVMEGTIADIERTLSAIIQFLGEMLGCPLAPDYWKEVESWMAEHDAQLVDPSESEQDIPMNLNGLVSELASGEIILDVIIR
jgi:hypothetical protein